MDQLATKTSEQFTPTPRRFRRMALERGEATAYRTLEGDGWKRTSWKSYLAEVEQAARALIALGVGKNDAVCILGFNRPEWTITAHAAMMIGARPAGIYFTSSPQEIAYILNHSEAPVLVAETAEHFARVAAVRDELRTLRHVVMMRGVEATDALQTGWEDFNALGEEHFSAEVEARLQALLPSDTGTLIYTSGTTGPPKAVMLSHGALAWTAWTLKHLLEMDGEMRMLSYLPYAHIAEAINTIHGPPMSGLEVWFARSLEELGAHLKDCKPTTFFAVPRVWQKMHETLVQRIGAATGVRAKLAGWALRVGRDFNGRTIRKEPVGPLLKWRYRLADRLVLGKVRAAIGLDRCVAPISGAAPISPDILDFFASLGIVIYEVYGQSEDCGPTTINLPGAVKLGTVGRPIPGMEVRIAEDGEVLIRAPSLFDGYAKDPQATAATLVDGWMKTGDLGRLDAEGYLTIIGRKKDIIITSGGKNIAPANIENDLMDIPLVEHAVVVGEGRNYLTALLTLAAGPVAAFAAEHGLAGNLAEDATVRAEIQKGVDAVNARYARVEHIRKFAVLPSPFSMTEGELTATLKVKRNVVIARNAAPIEALYAR